MKGVWARERGLKRNSIVVIDVEKAEDCNQLQNNESIVIGRESKINKYLDDTVEKVSKEVKKEVDVKENIISNKTYHHKFIYNPSNLHTLSVVDTRNLNY